jgi:hypothetical protein
VPEKGNQGAASRDTKLAYIEREGGEKKSKAGEGEMTEQTELNKKVHNRSAAKQLEI